MTNDTSNASAMSKALGQRTYDVDIDSALATMAPVSLEVVVAAADLQTRVDRKYLLRPDAFVALVPHFAGIAHVLEIDDARAFSYESVYFDTPDRAAYRASAHSRRRRFKVRTRTYADSGACVLEVKTMGGRGQTIKMRWPYDLRHRATLTPDALEHVDRSIGIAGIGGTLEPVLTTVYKRSTMLSRELDFRITADTRLAWTSPSGLSMPMIDRVLVETKSHSSSATRPDRALWAAGHRPLRISKYCVGMAALHAELPANKWHRTLSEHLYRTPLHAI